MKHTRHQNRILSQQALILPVAILLPLSLALLLWPDLNAVLRFVAGLLLILSLGVAAWLTYCHRIFAYNAGQLEAKLLDILPAHLSPVRSGDLLDVGTGSGYLAISCVHLFPNLRAVGLLDRTTAGHSGADRCRENAKVEAVADRLVFTEGNLTNLPFAADSFDAVVSAFAFKNIKNNQDRWVALLEAIRVCKAGGVFVFQDFFGRGDLYGDVQELVAGLESAGLREVHFISDLDQSDFVPPVIRATGLLRGAGLIFGMK